MSHARQRAPTKSRPPQAHDPKGASRVEIVYEPKLSPRAMADDIFIVDMELERGAPFCANPACPLHVRLRDPEVEGGGNWVSLPDGRTFGRSRFGDRALCDACGTRRGPIELPRRRL